MLEFSFVWLVSNIEKVFVYDVVMFESDTTWIDADLFSCLVLVLFGSNTIHDSSRYMPGGVCEATDQDVVMFARTENSALLFFPDTCLVGYAKRHM